MRWLAVVRRAAPMTAPPAGGAVTVSDRYLSAQYAAVPTIGHSRSGSAR
jgi:hypothetical protein